MGEKTTTCPLCGKQSAVLVEGPVDHWHCWGCHREWPKGDGVLSEEGRWTDDDGEMRH